MVNLEKRDMIIKEVKQVEEFSKPKLDISLFRKKSNAKIPSGVVLGKLKQIKDVDNFNQINVLELKIILQEIYKKINSLEKHQKVVLDNWKGKSSFDVIESPDKFIVITYQKPDKFSEPKEIKREVTKEEYNRIMKIIFESEEFKTNSKTDSVYVGETYYKDKWDNIFSDRQRHIQLNTILRLLDKKNKINYRGKYIYKNDKN